MLSLNLGWPLPASKVASWKNSEMPLRTEKGHFVFSFAKKNTRLCTEIFFFAASPFGHENRLPALKYHFLDCSGFEKKTFPPPSIAHFRDHETDENHETALESCISTPKYVKQTRHCPL